MTVTRGSNITELTRQSRSRHHTDDSSLGSFKFEVHLIDASDTGSEPNRRTVTHSATRDTNKHVESANDPTLTLLVFTYYRFVQLSFFFFAAYICRQHSFHFNHKRSDTVNSRLNNIAIRNPANRDHCSRFNTRLRRTGPREHGARRRRGGLLRRGEWDHWLREVPSQANVLSCSRGHDIEPVHCERDGRGRA